MPPDLIAPDLIALLPWAVLIAAAFIAGAIRLHHDETTGRVLPTPRRK